MKGELYQFSSYFLGEKLKYIVRTTKTPFLDCTAIFTAVVLDYFLTAYIFENIYGVSIDAKLVNLPDSVTVFMVFAFCVWALSFFAFVYLFRHLAEKWFSVRTGDPVVELDTENKESKTYVNGKLESVKKWKK